jgi:dipeptidyl aminopeptidase/acylaminoacyl peptidase
MANRKITVLNPTGYQELFQSGDVLVLDGSVDLQSNGITGIPDPTQNLDCSNKKYVDDTKALLDSDIVTVNTSLTSNIATVNTNLTNDIATVNTSLTTNIATVNTNLTSDISTLNTNLSNDITTVNTNLTSDIATINTNITNLTNSIGNGTISFSASQNMTVSGSLTTNQAGNSTITLTGPDLTNLLPKPSTDGVYVVSKTGASVTYVEEIDGGSY